VQPFRIVQDKVALQTGEECRHRHIPIRVDVLVLDGAPQPLHEDVVIRSTTAVHADANASIVQYRGEGLRRELGSVRRCARVANLSYGDEFLRGMTCRDIGLEALYEGHDKHVNI
jgi:hypothetical protein